MKKNKATKPFVAKVMYSVAELQPLFGKKYLGTRSMLRNLNIPIRVVGRRFFVYAIDIQQEAPELWQSMFLVSDLAPLCEPPSTIPVMQDMLEELPEPIQEIVSPAEPCLDAIQLPVEPAEIKYTIKFGKRIL